MIRVLFVCTGNICRSPMAEALFRHQVMESGFSNQVTVDSAGTDGWHAGEPAHRGTQDVLARHHISQDGLISRQITRDEIATWDYILVMDQTHLDTLSHLAPDGIQVRRLLDYHPDPHIGRNVPDPYSTGRFEQVYDLILPAIQAFWDCIKETLE